MSRMRERQAVLILAVFCSPAFSVECDLLREKWATYQVDFGIPADWKWECESRIGEVSLALYHLEAAKTEPGGVSFYPWAAHLIHGIRYSSTPYNQAVATAQNGTVTIYENFFKSHLSSAFQASKIVHEARHLEKDDPVHAECTKGYFKGYAQGCDAIFSDGNAGSGYNYDVRFLAFVKNRTKYSELSEAVLQSELNYLIPDRFNEVTEKQLLTWRR